MPLSKEIEIKGLFQGPNGEITLLTMRFEPMPF